MHTRELVESIALARKSAEPISDDSFRKLGERIFYVPLQTVRNSSEPGGGKKVRFLTIDRGNKRVVPAFSTEDLLFEWSAGEYQFLPVAGADLVISLPKGLLVEFDPESQPSLLLQDEDLGAILSFDETPSTQSFAARDPSSAPHSTTEAAPASNTKSAPVSAPVADEHEEPQAEPEPEPLPLPPKVEPPDASEVEGRLSKLFQFYPAIAEAYYLGAEEGILGGLLGLLVGARVDGAHWDSEQRFGLVESIAELARELYGYAGAIEVYDDLENESSGSWDLFKGQNLFYRREKMDDGVAEENHLEEPAQKPSGPGSWLRPAGGLRKKTASLIGVVPGVRMRQNEKNK